MIQNFTCTHCGREYDEKAAAVCLDDDCPQYDEAGDCGRRANRVEAALGVYAQLTEADSDDPETLLSDVLADLRHYADKHGLEWVHCDGRAHDNYVEESAERIHASINARNAEALQGGDDAA